MPFANEDSRICLGSHSTEEETSRGSPNSLLERPGVRCIPGSRIAQCFGCRAKSFDLTTFEAAQAEGKPIVVDIAADWCPTCAAQKPIIDRLAADEAHRDVMIFHVDFDEQRDVVRMLGAQFQSTLIAYNGRTETARSVGDTDPASIAALFRSALGE